jgi:outer membrane protein TolC
MYLDRAGSSRFRSSALRMHWEIRCTAKPQAVAGLRSRLFDFGRVDAEVKQARGANAEALVQYRKSVLRATEDVEDSFSALAQSEFRSREVSQEISSLQRVKNLSQQFYEAA